MHLLASALALRRLVRFNGRDELSNEPEWSLTSLLKLPKELIHAGPLGSCQS